MNHPQATPHSPPQQIGDNLFVVYGSIKANPVVRFTRNMAIVRQGDVLTLINSVRMDEAGLAALEQLGEVKHVLRLGPLHGIDDPFYVERYGAQFWSFADGTTYSQPAPDHVLSAQSELPFGPAQLYVFDHLTESEGVILLPGSPGVLLTTDCIQSYVTPPHKPHTNALARLLMPFIGFPNKTLIGPIWMQRMVTDRAAVQETFLRLLTLDFDQLLSAHGVFLAKGAKAEVRRAYETMFEDSAQTS